MSLINNPYKNQNVLKSLVTPIRKQQRSYEEEQERLKRGQKVSTVASALKLLGDMVYSSQGADVLPDNNEFMPYSVDRMNYLKESSNQADMALNDRLLQNMYQGIQYDTQERRRDEDETLTKEQQEKQRQFRASEAEKSRQYKDEYAEKWNLAPDQQMDMYRQKEDYETEQYLNRLKAKTKIEKVAGKDGEFAVKDESGNTLAVLNKYDINTLFTKFNKIPEEKLSEMPVTLIAAMKLGDKLSDDQKMQIISDNWDVLGKYYQPDQQSGVTQGQTNVEPDMFNTFIESVMTGSYKEEGKKTAIRNFMKDNGFSQQEIDGFINRLFENK